ncbi:MAG: hypothetical protein K2J95_10440 [Lachnospiraceae bacterium]|nr:hypothetical protein [Lachnospiraceae bacterium]
MAYLINSEGNVEFVLELGKEYEMGNSDHETWMPGVLRLSSETKNVEMGKDINFTLNVYEVKQLVKGINNLISCFGEKESSSFSFCNMESNFELKFDNILEDEVIEIEVWINIANQTKGNIFGYDEGIRFIANKEKVQKFADAINEDLLGKAD